jgi:hypothetical protein
VSDLPEFEPTDWGLVVLDYSLPAISSTEEPRHLASRIQQCFASVGFQSVFFGQGSPPLEAHRPGANPTDWVVIGERIPQSGTEVSFSDWASDGTIATYLGIVGLFVAIAVVCFTGLVFPLPGGIGLGIASLFTGGLIFLGVMLQRQQSNRSSEILRAVISRAATPASWSGGLFPVGPLEVRLGYGTITWRVEPRPLTTAVRVLDDSDDLTADPTEGPRLLTEVSKILQNRPT